MSNSDSNMNYEKQVEDLHAKLKLPPTLNSEVYKFANQDAAEIASHAAMSMNKNSNHAYESDCLEKGTLNTSELYRKYIENKVAYERELGEKEHEIHYLKAIIRQYRTKFKKVRTLIMAGIGKEDMLLESGNADYECGKLTSTLVDSDHEDSKDINKVDYSYIDNELFLNEL